MQPVFTQKPVAILKESYYKHVFFQHVRTGENVDHNHNSLSVSTIEIVVLRFLFSWFASVFVTALRAIARVFNAVRLVEDCF